MIRPTVERTVTSSPVSDPTTAEDRRRASFPSQSIMRKRSPKNTGIRRLNGRVTSRFCWSKTIMSNNTTLPDVRLLFAPPRSLVPAKNISASPISAT